MMTTMINIDLYLNQSIFKSSPYDDYQPPINE